MAWLGSVGVRLGMVRYGEGFLMGLGRAWYGVARLGLVWCGSIKKLLRKGFVWQGTVSRGSVR